MQCRFGFAMFLGKGLSGTTQKGTTWEGLGKYHGPSSV